MLRTRYGLIRGRAHDGIVAYKGIPYAAAPDGVRRFLPPQPPAPWDGVREADAFGSAPPQRPPAPGVPAVWQAGDGLDCLTVNVWTSSAEAGGMPVMVWIYGGQWSYGASSMAQYDGGVLARSGVVVVTFNYRTGFEGFGHVPGVPDNRGLLDQIAALAWVQENIAAFGGDPGNVTVFGQSAGAASAALLAATPRTAGLFRRCILQSLPTGYLTVAEARQVTERLAAATGAALSRDGLAALRPKALLNVPDDRRPGTAFAPVIDGDLVTAPPWQALRDGRAGHLDLLCGFTHDEYSGTIPAGVDPEPVAARFGLDAKAALTYRATYANDAVDALMSDALVRMPTTWTAEAHARAKGRTWLYDFAWRGPSGATHGIDVPFVFGLPETRYAARFLGSPPPAGFAALSERIRTAWTSFATTGDPGWPRYEPELGTTRIWDTTSADTAYPLPESHRLWSHARHP